MDWGCFFTGLKLVCFLLEQYLKIWVIIKDNQCANFEGFKNLKS